MQEAQASSERSPHRKIDVTSKPPVGGISVVTLIRTDTTLDHSQKAEKVCQSACGSPCCLSLLTSKFACAPEFESADALSGRQSVSALDTQMGYGVKAQGLAKIESGTLMCHTHGNL